MENEIVVKGNSATGGLNLVPEKPMPFVETGVTGLNRTKGVGYVYEEWLRDLSTYRQKQVFREMRDNDPVIGAMFFAVEMILRRATWTVEPAEDSGKEGDDVAKFIDECLQDMSSPFEDFIAEAVSMLAFGFALFEVVYKKRAGPGAKQSSKYSDGKIGWRKFAPRAQESILYWIWDDEGGLQGAVQLAAPDYNTVPMAIEKLLLFRTTSLKNNPEGRSILRNCFVPWFRKRRIEEVEGIGIERDACGMPVLTISAEVLKVWGQGNQEAGQQLANKLVRNIRVDDQMGVVLPAAFDDDGNPLVKLELIKAAGSKMLDVGATIGRYDQNILNTLLAGFIQFGQTPTGSRSLHVSATDLFAEAVSALMDSMAAVLNRIEIPRLLVLNGIDLELAPKLVPGEIGAKDTEGMSTIIKNLSAGGLTFFDTKTANFLRKMIGLPDLPDEPTPSPTAGAGAPVDPNAPIPEQGAPPPGLESGKVARAQQVQSASPESHEEDAVEVGA